MGGDSIWYLGHGRTLCDVLEEMRKCDKTKNYAAINSLIEEVQILGNRMESGLEQKRNFQEAEEHRKKLKKEIKGLIKERNKLKGEVDEAGSDS